MNQTSLIHMAIADLLVAYCEECDGAKGMESALATAIGRIGGPGGEELREALHSDGRRPDGARAYADRMDALAETYSSPALTTMAMALRTDITRAAMKDHLRHLAALTADMAWTLER